MSSVRRELSPTCPKRLMSVVAEDDEEFEERVIKTRSPRMAKACLQEGADGPTVKTSLLQRSPTRDRPSKHAGWKTSKFFSKSMASGELLRGFKKFSLSSTSGDDLDMRGQSDSKQYKPRLGSLKKRPTSDDMFLSVDVSSASSNSIFTKPEPVQDKGIVCKKDDILSIIANVPQPSEISPGRRRTPLRYTKSASLDPGFIDSTPLHTYTVPLLGSADKIEEGKVEEIDETVSKTNGGREEVKESEDMVTDKDDIDSTVQWDDSNFVDAMLLGGAIEAFLKGSMGTSNAEKRVSFKKP